MQKYLLFIASTFGVFAVAIGAFGAHLFQELLLQNDRVDTFETASSYHFYHSITLLFVSLLLKDHPTKTLKYSAISFVLGIIIFSGSLYTLSLTNITILGAITPLGGVFFIIGWSLLAVFALRKK